MRARLGHERLEETDSAPPASLRAWTLIVDALASYRLTKLARDDLITQPFRDGLHSRFGPPSESKISYLFQCPWCMSIYFGLGLSLAHRRGSRVVDIATHALAVSALTGLLKEQVEDR